LARPALVQPWTCRSQQPGDASRHNTRITEKADEAVYQRDTDGDGIGDACDATPGNTPACTAGAGVLKTSNLRGTGKTNTGVTVPFRADADDLSTNGTLDLFAIQWPGYSASGVLKSGNISIGCR